MSEVIDEKVYFSKENLKRMDELERFIRLLKPTKENMKQIEQYQKELEDTKNFYTEDSVEQITIMMDAEKSNTRPLRVKGMKRKPLSLEKTIMKTATFSIAEIRKYEGW
jgi:hypothetical protein